MCIGQQAGIEQRAVLLDVNADVVDVNMVTAQQVGTRTYRQPMKARLPRRLTSSARINLNHHWSALEELVTCSLSFPAQTSDHVDNEINENLANERLEEANRAFNARYLPVISTDLSSRDRITVIPEAISKSKRHFWNVFRNQCSKRKTPSILKIVQKLSNQSQ